MLGESREPSLGGMSSVSTGGRAGARNGRLARTRQQSSAWVPGASHLWVGSLRLLPTAIGAGLLCLLVTCYTLAVSLGHVDAWLPDITHTALHSPERYVFRAVMIPLCVGVMMLWVGIFFVMRGERLAVLVGVSHGQVRQPFAPLLPDERRESRRSGLLTFAEDGGPMLSPGAINDSSSEDVWGAAHSRNVDLGCIARMGLCSFDGAMVLALALGVLGAMLLILSTTVLELPDETPWKVHIAAASSFFLVTLCAVTIVVACNVALRRAAMKSSPKLSAISASTTASLSYLFKKQDAPGYPRLRLVLCCTAWMVLIVSTAMQSIGVKVEHLGPLTEWTLTLHFVVWFASWHDDFKHSIRVAVVRPSWSGVDAPADVLEDGTALRDTTQW